MLQALCALLAAVSATLLAQKPENVLVVVNESSALSKSIGEYYVLRRGVPLANVCRLQVSSTEDIARSDYDRAIAAPIARYLRSQGLVDQILYIVTTSDVPLRISGTDGLT